MADIDQVYRERNLLALAFIQAYSRTDAGEESQYGYWHSGGEPEDWPVVWCDIDGVGQVGWHMQKEMIPDWLPEKDPDYDGYSTKEKNRRVVAYANGYE